MRLARELRRRGYEPTGRESPFSENAQLWSNSYELVCDSTAVTIRKDEDDVTVSQSSSDETTFELSANHDADTSERDEYRYDNSGRVQLPGGYVSSYDWGKTDSKEFVYDTG